MPGEEKVMPLVFPLRGRIFILEKFPLEKVEACAVAYKQLYSLKFPLVDFEKIVVYRIIDHHNAEDRLYAWHTFPLAATGHC